MATNGKDEEQAAQQEGQQEGQQPASMPVLGLITVDPETGALMMQINPGVIKEPMPFFLAVSQLALGNATSEYHKSQSSKILVPKRQVARL